MIDVAFTLEELGATSLDGVTAIVIDVVRASTTIAAALAHGATGILPVASPEEAEARARRCAADCVLLGGERGGLPPPGFDLGNSPAEYTADRVAGRTVIFTTTNGTRALLAVAGAGRVAVGGFVNAGAVVRWIGEGVGDTMFVCAGELGRFCLEDATCAGFFVHRLTAARPREHLTDAARAAATLYLRYERDLGEMLGHATWAQALIVRGRGADLPLCVATDAYDVVPVARDGILTAAVRGPIDSASGPPG